MPQESSAVADLVSLAHREPIHASPDPNDPHGSGRGRGVFSGPWIVLIGMVVIGASVAGGYFMARQEAGEQPQTAALSAEAEVAGVDTAPTLAAVAPADAAEAEIEPAPAPVGEVDIELAKVTGFDVLVEPSGAKVSLDGQPIGAAPLRVRNLLPGKHAIDIEGPNGYFGKHLEFDLSAGEAEVLTLVLDPVGEGVASAEVIVPESTDRDGEPEGAAYEERGEPANRDSADKEQRGNADKRERRRRFKASADEEKILRKAAKVALGTLMLGAKPPCDIIINGKRTGLKTPQRAIQLPAGMHRVVLINKKHKIRKAFKVRIKAGLTTRAIQDLSDKI